MRHPTALAFLAPLALGLAACASVKDGPSLAPRAAERIDPRLPIVDRSGALPADGALVARLTAARDAGVAASRTADAPLQTAASAATSAGAPGSESWIAAQQLLSAAIAARAPFAAALGDFDRLVAERVQIGARLVPRDLAAAERLRADLTAIDQRQAGIIATAQARLQR